MENKEKITRKEAIKKAGLTALAASSLLFLETKAHASTSGRPSRTKKRWRRRRRKRSKP